MIKNMWSGFKGTLGRMVDPKSYVRLFQEGPTAAMDSIKRLREANFKEAPMDYAGKAADTFLNVVLPAYGALDAINPFREDLDTAGPFEEMGTRLSEMGLSLMGASDPFFKGNMLGALSAYSLAVPTISGAAKGVGKMIDKATDNRPDPVEVKDSFNAKVNRKMEHLKKLNPLKSKHELVRSAVNSVLEEASEYLDYFPELNK